MISPINDWRFFGTVLFWLESICAKTGWSHTIQSCNFILSYLLWFGYQVKSKHLSPLDYHDPLSFRSLERFQALANMYRWLVWPTCHYEDPVTGQFIYSFWLDSTLNIREVSRKMNKKKFRWGGFEVGLRNWAHISPSWLVKSHRGTLGQLQRYQMNVL